MFEWLYMYCFHMIKQYSSYKITIFPSFINTLYWKSLVYHGFYLKSFLPPNTQKSLKALIFSTFLSSPVLSCGKQAFCFYNMIKQYFSEKTYHYKFFRALSHPYYQSSLNDSFSNFSFNIGASDALIDNRISQVLS